MRSSSIDALIKEQEFLLRSTLDLEDRKEIRQYINMLYDELYEVQYEIEEEYYEEEQINNEREI